MNPLYPGGQRDRRLANAHPCEATAATIGRGISSRELTPPR